MYTNFIIFLLIFKVKCHEAKTSDDVIVTYSNHADAVVEPKIIETSKTTTKKATTDVATTAGDGDVVFVPNNNNFREAYDSDAVMMRDVMNENIKPETEAPKTNVFFVSGKNNDADVREEPRRSERKNFDTHYDVRATETKNVEILDCKHLSCNNTLDSVCGGKLERSHWRYRLFLNECYYRKVNCAFSYEYNRYRIVSDDKCKTVGSHHPETSYIFRPMSQKGKREKTDVISRRSFVSRRSLNRDADGVGCGHPCPVHCLDEYQPECAMSDSGQLKVFENHCKLDYYSCINGVSWRVRPLSVCVGGKKADLQQNKAFVGWMQRVGIVDRKGKLVLS